MTKFAQCPQKGRELVTGDNANDARLGFQREEEKRDRIQGFLWTYSMTTTPIAQKSTVVAHRHQQNVFVCILATIVGFSSTSLNGVSAGLAIARVGEIGHRHEIFFERSSCYSWKVPPLLLPGAGGCL